MQECRHQIFSILGWLPGDGDWIYFGKREQYDRHYLQRVGRIAGIRHTGTVDSVAGEDQGSPMPGSVDLLHLFELVVTQLGFDSICSFNYSRFRTTLFGPNHKYSIQKQTELRSGKTSLTRPSVLSGLEHTTKTS